MARAYNPDGDSDWITGEGVAQAAMYLVARAARLMIGQFIDFFWCLILHPVERRFSDELRP